MSIETTLLRSAAAIKVVGVKSYSDAVASCQVGDPVRVVHEPTNEYDTNAMRVDLMNGQQIGYLPAALASRIVQEAEHSAFSGRITDCRVYDGVVVGIDVTLDTALG